MDHRKVQMLIIDDAAGNASSRQVYEQVEVIKEFNTLRHILKDKQNGGGAGLVIVIFSWQRFADLDPALRDGTVMIFKTGSASIADSELIEGYLGSVFTDELYDIWYRIIRGDQSAKAESVALITPLQRKGSGVGLYVTKMTDFPEWPEIIRADDYYDDTALYASFIEKNRDNDKWSVPIRCYELTLEGIGQSDIARDVGVKQGTVSKMLARLKKEVRKG
jgi:hypothetical protein